MKRQDVAGICSTSRIGLIGSLQVHDLLLRKVRGISLLGLVGSANLTATAASQ